MTTGATGGTANKRKTDGEEARGGERDARAGKLSGDMELGRGNLGRGNLGGGREGGTRAISGIYNTILTIGTESSDWVAAVLGLEKPPNNEQAIWSQ